MSDILKNLDPKAFFQLMPERNAAIEKGSPDRPKTDYPVNRLAKALHPEEQHLIISEIEDHGADARTYTLVPDQSKGTDSCAIFEAGQYLSVHLDIDGSHITRPYSICSSPSEASEGFYKITVKRAPDGFASDHILSNWKTGDKVTVSGPCGNFCYERLRDAKTIIGLAGGSGITPFLSLAKAIADGDEECDLILLYGSRTEDKILFKSELDQLMSESERIKIVHVLSHEKHEGYEYGFISSELIKKYAPEGDYSVFVCGPPQMYHYLKPEIAKLGLERKFVRFELFEVSSSSKAYTGFDPQGSDKNYTARIRIHGEEKVITCSGQETLLTSMEKNGIAAPSKCRSGQCGYCHSRLISGNIQVPPDMDYRRMADHDFGFIHPCCSFPVSDVEIEIYPL